MTLREQQEWMDLRGGSSQVFVSQPAAYAGEHVPQAAQENTAVPTDAQVEAVRADPPAATESSTVPEAVN